MPKSQFNIKISTDLLLKIKRQAMMSGKSLTEHITDLVTKSLSDHELKNNDLFTSNSFKDLEERLLSLESIVKNREYLSKKIKPFTNSEAINCTKFMRGFFEIEVKKRNFDNKEEAFEDFLQHVKTYYQLNDFFTDRLKEIMLGDNPEPWTGPELNEFSHGDKCNCSIRKGLINWTGKIDCPSQQEICDKGSELLESF
tara:strand:+ start:93 stop:686 length:594 start_codon:yes stop_codon:yes gene_type:complete